ncbi:diaminohydroxyphosphoribosylaminopyrimidine deaminase [Actinopolyspora alba]|uniref:diaminohydroxyphosphoribosylaminopyrimidine deaminase n=1 Tax=Actinopolyspora alba TaxID=673379 RepID=A0A1I1UD87_9ACTN|nr:bifunctional diaminohydroxyphosphoribosylaminopyrimidine deaminase/5-amino-6-(5-phosphoribosylamino)uracil reductase RibD [Actinopolyspora alba]SFD68801.1 diaminohydroxyphosphoribosylaminopyrimidine deaminase [Actinopolyspora alba]
MTITTAEVETRAMRHAIALSAWGHGTTSPNPPVGCVVLDGDGRLVGQGWHRRKGEPHAEAYALAQAGSAADGGTAVVTLEPCCHHGRTPPCHRALIEAGIARVVIAVLDPTSRGRGGAALLREAGIDVVEGLLVEEAHLVLGPWLAALEWQRPVLTWGCCLPRQGSLTGDGTVLPGEIDTLVHDDTSTIMTTAIERPVVRTLSTLPHDPHQALTALQHEGARTVGLAVGGAAIRPYLDAGLIDHIEAHSPHETAHLPHLPDEYRLTRLSRLNDGLRLSLTRNNANTI